MSWRFKATTQSLFGFPSNHFMQNLSGNGENLGRGGGGNIANKCLCLTGVEISMSQKTAAARIRL